MTQGAQISPYWMNGDTQNPAWRQQERLTRIHKLVKLRGMSIRAATIVVESAMFGTHCLEGRVRQEIENAKANMHQ